MIQGPQNQKNMFASLGVEKSGIYSAYLDELVKTGYIARDYTWKLNSGSYSKLSHYRLCDNYLRFYLKFIEPNKHNILQDRDLLPAGWTSMMGLQFENLVLNNRHKLHELLNIRPPDIRMDNPYFQKGTKSSKGVQIDYMIETRFKTLYICEIKFCRDRIGAEVIKEMRQKIEALDLPRGYSVQPVLIHVNGVTSDLEEQDFFSHIIDFGSLLTG